jgi:hypothetical protein
MKTGLLPVDSRPCTYDFPRQLAAAAGRSLLEPPREIMDHFREPSRYETIAGWLAGAAETCDTLVVSVEQLVYGGLIASRQRGPDAETARSRLGILEDLKARHPRIRLLGFTVLMRSTVSALSRESRDWWEKVAAWSQAAFPEEASGAAETAAALAAEIPPAVLEEFLSVRRRNHGINMACVELAARGIFDRLLILQEDCAPAGPHRAEQRALKERIRETNTADRVFLYNGTDEAASCLVIRSFMDEAAGPQIPVDLIWLEGEGDFIARYEDRPFRENLALQLRAMNMVPVSGAPHRLFIYPPRGDQGDLYQADYPGDSGYREDELAAFSGEIARTGDAGCLPYLLDLAYANGGDLPLIRALSARIAPADLGGYAAWNTAGNSLGTILAQIGAVHLGGRGPRNRLFTAERFLDDLLYQGLVRRRTEARLRARGRTPGPWPILPGPRSCWMRNGGVSGP